MRREGQPGFRLGHVRGIEIRIDWSLAVVFALIVFNLGAGLFPLRHPEWAPGLRWLLAAIAAMLFFASVLAHELAHALVARRFGVPVQGITLFIFGGVARIAGEPPSARAELAIAAVGPLASLAIGAGAVALGVALGRGGPWVTLAHGGALSTLLLWLGPINLLLGVFNLLPGFPLDGGRVLRAALWGATGDLEKATRWASAVGSVIALALVFVGMLMMFGHVVPVLGGGFVQGLWLILIGWFLHNGALVSRRRGVVREQLRGVPVARLMRQSVTVVNPANTLDALADRFLQLADERCLPVVDRGVLVGTVCAADLRRVPRAEWPAHTVAQLMTPVDAATVAAPGDQVAQALEKLSTADVDQIPVVDGGLLRGVLRRADVLRWLELQTA